MQCKEFVSMVTWFEHFYTCASCNKHFLPTTPEVEIFFICVYVLKRICRTSCLEFHLYYSCLCYSNNFIIIQFSFSLLTTLQQIKHLKCEIQTDAENKIKIKAYHSIHIFAKLHTCQIANLHLEKPIIMKQL